ncbi:hypothetical protein BIU88_05755 [Chlorobaculum limnaeum]|uniref:Uncharacterized protein n=1 Tax=Chlorobaculum limnaeum TaxID=274537 RepID=A0A1D8CXN3_CHLLM|nr:hypothetical protein BIU88_05755 [Chlorobaculum limnaeum]
MRNRKHFLRQVFQCDEWFQHHADSCEVLTFNCPGLQSGDRAANIKIRASAQFLLSLLRTQFVVINVLKTIGLKP